MKIIKYKISRFLVLTIIFFLSWTSTYHKFGNNRSINHHTNRQQGLWSMVRSDNRRNLLPSYSLWPQRWTAYARFLAAFGTYRKRNITIVCAAQNITELTSVAEPVEPRLFCDLEPEPEINFSKHFLQSVLMLLEQFLVPIYGWSWSRSRSRNYYQSWSRSRNYGQSWSRSRE